MCMYLSHTRAHARTHMYSLFVSPIIAVTIRLLLEIVDSSEIKSIGVFLDLVPTSPKIFI